MKCQVLHVEYFSSTRWLHHTMNAEKLNFNSYLRFVFRFLPRIVYQFLVLILHNMCQCKVTDQ